MAIDIDIVHVVTKSGVIIGVFDLDTDASLFAAQSGDGARFESWVIQKHEGITQRLERRLAYEVDDVVMYNDGSDAGNGKIDFVKSRGVYRIVGAEGIVWMTHEEILGMVPELLDVI